ncbi:glucosaminidase domain-containing protein [Urechidicola croceus]|uniref:Peptidoglycan hydrolase n=1 Tax=Urechidicola croceus TaxID=1850246 RepID=A0A1D8PAV6_9FLAO|nr:glucosaminidase domain-containing protein [Urechidicola croceus]AOW21686.1 N-acetylmuramidase [Urechidicola croceus]
MKIRTFVVVLVTVLVSSCGSKKKVVSEPKKEYKTSTYKKPPTEIYKPQPTETTTTSYADDKLQYIADYNEIAIEEMQAYRIPASITLAQGILESRAGKSELTTKSNNHFGIKCHTGWKGGRTYHDDDEKGECFRVYLHPSYSFRDHSLFLSGRKRYMSLFQLDITDYKNWAKGLQKAGYATDKAYPRKLIKIIEDYELYKYDAIALGKSVEEVKSKKPDSHIVKKGDTLYSISRKYKLSVDQLKAINGLENNTISVGQKLYVTGL